MQQTKGLTHLINSTRYSIKGLKAALTETAFRQELILTAILVPLALWLGKNKIECILLICSVLLVLVVELLNTGIEAVVNRIGTEYHELSGRAKDLGSAAVFVALVILFVTWVGILLF